MTFSIVARSADGTTWGVAVASKFLAVGSAVPAAIAGLGAIATQALANVGYKAQALSLLDEGGTAKDVLAQLLADDEGREDRQVGLVDAAGDAATFTGSRCYDWAGGRIGSGVAAQGNILTGPEVVDAMITAFEASPADLSLERRLLAALAAGDAAGGDRRGRQSAALLVVREGAGYDGGDDIATDLRVDDHADPVNELARLLTLSELYLTASTAEEQIPIDGDLAEELARRVARLGHPDLTSWVGTENYEMRVAADESWIDRRVLEILREETPGE